MAGPAPPCLHLSGSDQLMLDSPGSRCWARRHSVLHLLLAVLVLSVALLVCRGVSAVMAGDRVHPMGLSWCLLVTLLLPSVEPGKFKYDACLKHFMMLLIFFSD